MSALKKKFVTEPVSMQLKTADSIMYCIETRRHMSKTQTDGIKKYEPR